MDPGILSCAMFSLDGRQSMTMSSEPGNNTLRYLALEASMRRYCNPDGRWSMAMLPESGHAVLSCNKRRASAATTTRITYEDTLAQA